MFAHLGLGLGHLKNSGSQGNHAEFVNEAQRRRASSNFMENLLSCPARFTEAIEKNVKEDTDLDEADNPHGLPFHES